MGSNCGAFRPHPFMEIIFLFGNWTASQSNEVELNWKKHKTNYVDMVFRPILLKIEETNDKKKKMKKIIDWNVQCKLKQLINTTW